MSIRHLDRLFHPQSVAVIGASNRPGSIGGLITRNLLRGGFSGPIMPVNPKQVAVAGVLAYAGVAQLPVVPDMAVICTPPGCVPEVVASLVQKGTRAAIVITDGLTRERDAQGGSLQDTVLALARAGGLRILGPNSLGILVPRIGLNASFSHSHALPGRIAFVSQSGALCSAVLDWARSQEIGFSHFISIGDGVDLDFGDVLDFLGSDPHTRSILLYIESIHERRNFMSAARAAARNKPVLVIKSGRAADGARAAAFHTRALAGADEVYDAAIKRAGMLRVGSVDELFAAVETLARAKPLRGERLCLLTNSGGLGVMAVDALVAMGGCLATLTPETVVALDRVLPPIWSRCNPVDIIGDAPAERYRQAVAILAAAKEVDALLVMHAPTASADPTAAARATIEAARSATFNIISSWLGGEAVAEARRLFNQAGVPTYITPERAVKAFIHLVRYRRNQELLMETPLSVMTNFTPDLVVARRLVEDSLRTGTSDLMREPDAKAVLAAYGIPTVATHVAATVDDAVALARTLRPPLALKILSTDISHKTDVGGVKLFLDSPAAVRAAGEKILQNMADKAPGACIQGFALQHMVSRPGRHELIIGMATDPIFGPFLLFGQGGTAVEVIGDRAVALPPLNLSLARELVSRTRVFRLLQGYRDRPPVDMEALCRTLVQVSQMVVDIPELVELDINPLFADEKGVLAVDARIRVTRAPVESRRLAISPYPKELEEPWTMADGRQVLLRPIRPEDEPEHVTFISRLTPEDIQFRFFTALESLPHSEMARLTQIDYDREMAFIASATAPDGGRETLAVVRLIDEPDDDVAEFAIVVRSDLKAQGLGGKLMDKIIRFARAKGNRVLLGYCLPHNHRLIHFVKTFGFTTRLLPEDQMVRVELTL
ncbi:MAG: bifunctional acetate--CoA ligase family protein/GNAT family N-acetyltransferase [Magnetococcales bacterium]|nr:bifunctional acetate--CoA ligase family protein/GNAT family N-acetyltransferase [Magnetococcales bacterium]